ncbi:MAG: hypothetical protein A2Z15_04310 [Chloroflexi bacterium RBG_16_50_11]|nr:MAG: hypothetical protein A2Z15_04310 [Chloroflexi bacterium RBG_16_50_11]
MANYISSTGGLESHPNIFYFSFPGLMLLGSSLSQITTLEDFDTVTVLTTLNAALFSALLYLLFLKTLKNSLTAAFAAIFLVQSSIMISGETYFYPGYFASSLLVAFLWLLNRQEKGLLTRAEDSIIAIILVMATTAMHFTTSLSFLFVLLGIYLVQKVTTRRMVKWTTVALYLIIILTWQMFWTYSTFDSLVRLIPATIERLSRGDIASFIFTVGEANLGPTLPLWAMVTRYFWLLIFAFGCILCVKNIVTVRRLGWAEVRETAGLLGIGLLSGVSTLASAGGYEAARLLMYGPIFTTPLFLRFFLQRKLLSVVLFVLFFILSLPTFLAHNGQIATYTFYDYDFSPGKFIASAYSKGDEPTLYQSYGDAMTPILYYALDVRVPNLLPSFFEVNSAEGTFQWLNNVLTYFDNSGDDPRLLIFSERMKGGYAHIMGIKPTDPRYEEFNVRLQNESRVYDNGHVQLYAPR